MFTTLKKISTIAIITSIMNIISSICLFMFVQSNTDNYTFIFFCALFLFSTSLFLLLFSCGMLGLSSDLEFQHNYLIKKSLDLKERVDVLEKKVQ